MRENQTINANLLAFEFALITQILDRNLRDCFAFARNDVVVGYNDVVADYNDVVADYSDVVVDYSGVVTDYSDVGWLTVVLVCKKQLK